MPSNNYGQYKPLFEIVFASGTAPYTTHSQMQLVKLVTGVEREHVQPYLGTDQPYRGTYSGASGIFLATDDPTASAEVLGCLDFSNAPKDALLLDYTFCGRATYLNLVSNEQFQNYYHALSGDDRREFAQDCRFFLESKGMLQDTQALVAHSASGIMLHHPGQVMVVLPPYSGALQYRGYRPVFGPQDT
jgi:hypothetical protein